VLHSFRLVVLAWALGLVAAPAAGQPASGRPNVVIILADDMGWSDIGPYGSEISTPHLDALAAGGLRFTQFCVTRRCSPSRASLLTGLYPHQAGKARLFNRWKVSVSALRSPEAVSAEHSRSSGSTKAIERFARADGSSTT
jgi:sulfatase-like protein